MRRLWVLLALGLALLGLKAFLDLTARKYPDVAVRGAGIVYHVPVNIVTNGDSWRADVSRMAGCWDARERGLPGVVGDCDEPRALHLDLTRLAGPRAPLLVRYASNVALWRNYAPPREQMDEVRDALRNGHARYREDWRLHRLEAPGSPWVFLLSAVPVREGELAGLFAGRCFRPDAGTDIGMSCTIVERLPGGVAFEYSLGTDAVPEVPALRREAQALLMSWRR